MKSRALIFNFYQFNKSFIFSGPEAAPSDDDTLDNNVDYLFTLKIFVTNTEDEAADLLHIY